MMKENYSRAIASIDVVESVIPRMFDILREERTPSEDYHVVLFLLSAFKDGLIITDNIKTEGYEQYLGIQIEQNNTLPLYVREAYATIIDAYEPIVSRIDKRGMQRLFVELQALNKLALLDNFSTIFDRVLYSIANSQGRIGGEFIQPEELTYLLQGLVDVADDAKVFNPFAGLASFGVHAKAGHRYFGQELFQKTWALGALRLMAYERFADARYVCSDSISDWPTASEQFDLIISNPPFGMKVEHQPLDMSTSSRTVEHFLIEKAVHSLSAKGQLIALLPMGFLFRGGQEQRLREYLVNKDLIETIISLPGGLILNTGVALVVLVIKKAKTLPGKIKFVDAKTFDLGRNAKEKVLDYRNLLTAICGEDKEADTVRLIPNELVEENGFDLSVPRYFRKQIEGVKLGELVRQIKGKRGNLPDKGKIIKVGDLKDENVDYELDLSIIKESDLKKQDVQMLEESCLLLSTRGGRLNPTLFEFDGTPIFKERNVIALHIKDSVVDKNFLVSELHSQYVQEQLQALQTTTHAIPVISTENLMELVIKLPSLREQQAKAQGIKELSNEIRKLKAERNALAHGRSIKEYNEFASLKHTLGRPRQNILDWSDNLLDFFGKQHGEFDFLNKKFADFYGSSVVSALKEIKHDINFITDVLEKGEKGFVLSSYNKQTIPLSDVNGIINDLSNNGFIFKIKKLLLKGDKLKERGIYANKLLLKALLDNILTNANKYAFDHKSENNEVIVELTEIENSLHLDIRNNGKPFPKHFDREKFITKYTTTDERNSSGLGGYDIDRIAAYFDNPDWILGLNEDPIHRVKFKFQFPVKLMK